MGKRKRKNAPTSEPSTTPKGPTTDKLRLGLLAATVATFVARPLVTSESAVLGDGLLLVMLLLLIGAFWAVSQIRNENARIRFNAIDAAVLLLVGLYCFSGLIAIPAGNARAVVNMIWLWIGLTAGYFLLRQLIDHAIEARAIVAIMIATTVAVASFGLYQYCWDFPQMRAAYAQDPDAMLRAEGMWYPPDSPVRQQFDNRLNSLEPIATFALTNSLAGFLAPWLIITAGLFLQPTSTDPSQRKQTRADRIKLALILLPIAACFILTKSRTAWAAVALGGLGLGLWWKLRGRTISMRWILTGSAVGIVLIAIAIAAGGLDSQVIGEAGKSLQYRFEYWQATTKMIAAEPWFGTGPGRYQDTYSQFKLPQSSEDPADPHNFLFEIAATAGLFALAAMIAVILLFFVRIKRNCLAVERSSTCFDDAPNLPSHDLTAQQTTHQLLCSQTKKFLYRGALIGYLASFPIGAMGTILPDDFIYWGALPIGILTLLGLDRWVRRGTLSPTLITIAWAVLAVNLLAAGGISFPGVAASFWMLLALGMWGGEPQKQEQESEQKPEKPKTGRRATKVVCAGSAFVAVGLLVACYYTAYGPVLASLAEKNAAYTDPRHAEDHFLRAAEADPWAVEPWVQLANLAYMQWQAATTPKVGHSLRFGHVLQFDKKFLRYDQEVLRRNPDKSLAWFVSAQRNHEAYQRMRRPDDQNRALDAYRRAVELGPNNARYRAEWALALQEAGHKAGHKADAQREAKKSLELDSQNPHQEKRLPESLIQRLEKVTIERVK